MSGPYDNVIDLPVITRLDIDPSRIIARASAMTFKRVLILGVLDDDTEFQASSAADGGTVLWDMERCRHRLMQLADEAP